MTKVVTYQSSRGDTVDLCARCTAAYSRRNIWLRDPWGAEYATVSHGLHRGECDAPIHEEERASGQERTDLTVRRLLGEVGDDPAGTDVYGVCVRQAVHDNPDVTAEEIRAVIDEASRDWAAELAKEEG